MLRSTWDYHLQPARFRAWLDQLTRNGTPVFNPIPLVSWNMDKVYLRALAVAGVALPDTIWLAASTGDDADHEAAQVHDAQDLMALLKRQRWTRAVVKPRISASAHGTRRIDPNTRLSPSDLATIASVGGLLQEYLPEIESAGELSLVFLDGAFSHAVRKTPRSGDFRVQQEFGGDVAGAEPSAAAQALAERSLATLREDWCYARIDLVESARGPVLMELELIEPDLFFRIDPAAADRLAESITKRLRR
ncbi:MAG: hypothetical protein R3E12_14625 [Candidatus Eisenbacteria bacterium]